MICARRAEGHAFATAFFFFLLSQVLDHLDPEKASEPKARLQGIFKNHSHVSFRCNQHLLAVLLSKIRLGYGEDPVVVPSVRSHDLS